MTANRTVKYWCEFHKENAQEKDWESWRDMRKDFGCQIVKIVEYRKHTNPRDKP